MAKRDLLVFFFQCFPLSSYWVKSNKSFGWACCHHLKPSTNKTLPSLANGHKVLKILSKKIRKKKKWNPSLVQPSRRNQYRCWNSDKQRMTLQLDQSSVGSVADVDTLGIYASDMACDALQYKNHNVFSNAKPDMHSVASSNAEG